MRRPQAPTLTALACVAVASVALLSFYRPAGRAELLGAEPAKGGSQGLEDDLARLGKASALGEDAVRDLGAGIVNDFLTGAARPTMGPRSATASVSMVAAPAKLAAPIVKLAAPAQAAEEPVHDARAKAAAKDADDYFERIPVTSTHVPKLPAATAEEDIAEWFNKMPAHNVNAFHEGSNAAHSAKYGNSERKARELDSYFNGLAASAHVSRGASLRAGRAAKEISSYFDQLPTAEPTSAFHEQEAARPSGSSPRAELTALPAAQAEASLSSYFDALPTRSVNAMHSAGGPAHEAAPSATFSAQASKAELDEYFSDVPTHNVNVFHEQAAALAAEDDPSPPLPAPLPLPRATAPVQRAAQVDAPEVPATEATASGRAPMEVRTSSLPFPMARAVSAVASVLAPARHTRTALGTAAARSARADPRSEWQQGPDGARGAQRGKAALEAAQERVMEEEKLARGKAVAGLSNDDQGPDPDAPNLPEEVRHANGYDTQYGPTAKLATRETEQTPSGPVTSSLFKATPEEQAQAAAPLGAPPALAAAV